MSFPMVLPDALASVALLPVVVIVLRATLLLGITALALVFARHQSASRRHVIIVLGTAGSLGASLVAAAGMQWRVGILPPASAIEATVSLGAGDVAPSLSSAHGDAVSIDVAPALALDHARAVATVDVSHIPDVPAIATAPAIPDVPPVPHVAPVSDGHAWAPGDAHAASVLPSLPSTPWLLGMLWIVGVVTLLGHYAIGVVRRTRLAWRASPLLPAPWERACHRLEARHKLPARVRILATEDTRMPMTWGVIRPTVLVPAWSDWSDDERDAALLHELAHVQRGDAFSLTLMTIVRAIHWFNPIAWWLTSAERLAREEACDDLVLDAGVRPSLYAEQLLAIVNVPDEERPPAAALAMARSSSLARRLCSILQPAQRRDLPGPVARGGLAIASLMLSACVGTFTPVARVSPVYVDAPAVAATSPVMPASGTGTGTGYAEAIAPATPELPPLDVAVATAPALAAPEASVVPDVTAPALATTVSDVPAAPIVATFPPRIVAAPEPQARCQVSRRGSSSNMSSISDDDDRRKVVWKQDGCEIEVSSRGKFTLAPSLEDVQSIAPGGYLFMREHDGKVEREVRITPGPNGALQYAYRVDGDRREWDAEARAWFASTAIKLDRRIAWAVDVRLPALLQSGGVEAVLAEIDRLDGDYARRVYFTSLARQARLTSAQLVRVVDMAAAKIDSDYEMAEMLVAVGKQPSFDEPVQAALARATKSIESSYERRRALGSLLQRDGLSPQTVGLMLQASRGMDSDYELAELLIAISNRYAMLPGTQQYYLDALGTIESDYEYRRVFTAMTKSGPISATDASVILDHAGAHMQGYELAELLLGIDKAVASDRSLGAPFLRALRRVDSGYEKGRVMQHLVRQTPDTTVVVQLLADSRTIDSSHERLQVLLAVSRAYRLDGKLRDAYLDAAESIDGDYERGQALAAATGRRTSSR